MDGSIFRMARDNIKAALPCMITDNGLASPRFSESNGGEFKCPLCGHTLKAYINRKGEWAINPLGNCSDFGIGGYSPDTFGLYAALTRTSESMAFKELMRREGVEWHSNNEKKANGDSAVLVALERRKFEREAAEREAERQRAAVKRFNLSRVMESSFWGFDMPTEGLELLFYRGIDMAALPFEIVQRIGFVNIDGLKCLGRDATYSIQGVVFSLGEEACQVRRTIQGRYIGKEDKLARFQTFGEANPFALDTLRQTDSNPVFITEGPFDALALYMAGAKRAIASMGAANHSRIVNDLPKTTKQAYVCYDPDEAGIKCGEQLVGELKEEGVNAIFLPMNGALHDANDLLLHNREGLRLRVELGEALAKLPYNAPESKLALEILHSSDITGSDFHLAQTVKRLQLKAILERRV